MSNMSNDSEGPVAPPDAASVGHSGDDARIRDLERAVARLEAQVRSLGERIADTQSVQRAAKQRALWLRILLLGVLVVGYVIIRSR